MRPRNDLSPTALAAALLPLAWLVPNHYLPWLSAWSEGLALALLAVAALAAGGPVRVPRALTAFVAVAAVSVLLQWADGRIFFGGDVIVVLLYLAALWLAVAVGSTLDATRSFASLDLVMAGLLAGALACTGLALAQWLLPPGDGVWRLVLPPGQRPMANLGQPNLLCSVLFVGTCAAAVLHERRHVGAPVLVLAWLFLVAGIVMTGSRTGGLQLLLLPLLALAFARRAAPRLRPALAALPLAAGVVLWSAWPAINDALMLAASRSVAEQMAPGVRLPYWRAMLDAVAAAPLAGYGWQQVAAALWQVALDGPPIRRAFEQSHNLVLDLVLWTGLPVGLLLAGLLATAVVQALRRLHEPAALWLMAGVLGLLVHAMLEYPLQFAYLLVPAGLMLGAAVALAQPPRERPRGLRAGALVFAAVLGFVAADVLEAEQNQRVLLFELARVGTLKVESPPPALRVLSQLQAFLSFVRTDPRPGMTEAELDAMRHAALRFPYAPSFARLAEALALNGRAEEARTALRKLCAMHTPQRCDAARERWNTVRAQRPELPPWP